MKKCIIDMLFIPQFQDIKGKIFCHFKIISLAINPIASIEFMRIRNKFGGHFGQP